MTTKHTLQAFMNTEWSDRLRDQ